MIEKTARAVPLGGVRVLLLREKLGPERERLEALGARVVHAAVLARVASAPQKALGGAFDWLVFTSASGVAAYARTAKRSDWALAEIAAIGPSTADAVESFLGRIPSFLPSAYTTRALARELPNPGAKKILLVRSANADDAMDRVLARRGARVTRINPYGLVYRPLTLRLCRMLERGEITHVMFGSKSQAEAFVRTFPTKEIFVSRRTAALAIGPETAKALKRFRLPFLQAKVHTFDGLIDLLLKIWIRD